ncbi:hypothetical protein [Novosphingobium cyanobacteriorum]|uniref:Uracil-DNA glycosylase n=1 Tax=Novosphingobium cyanobacteriorum TaxID=3024215 RepID=A0ABT6CJC9_9SPHN|nr:hypothetical protein [Novosphingobium cyanobacteriorum]MDF8333916.1 hypothetical protein [Novosphingobium cyanobacteriorum]
MTAQNNITLAIKAALDWWREAGVDCDFVDDPQNWLARAAPAKPRTIQMAGPAADAAPPPPRVGGSPESWPTDLAEFRAWWLSDPSLAPSGLRRVAPSGEAGADLMVLVAMPLADDGDTLFSGKAAPVIDAMLGAMGLDRSRTYCASALPARVAMPDWATLAAEGLGAVLAHHVALAAPRRLLVLGQKDISPLLGHDPAQSGPNLRSVDHEGGSVPAMAAADLELILGKGSSRAQLWNRWLDWTGNQEL